MQELVRENCEHEHSLVFMHVGVSLSCVAFEGWESNLDFNHRPMTFQLYILGQLISFSFAWFSHLENGHLASHLVHS